MLYYNSSPARTCVTYVIMVITLIFFVIYFQVHFTSQIVACFFA
jgi:hypothetical protein